MNNRCKIIAIAKNEAAYIPQWIAHHLYFGFEEIEIWVNGTTDNSLSMLGRIAKKYPGVKFQDANAALHKCQESRGNFQVSAYQAMLEATEQENTMTHIICLDLDELWTPKDFVSSIGDAISDYTADAISFQWHLDTPSDETSKFSRPFHESNIFQKNRHVKTIAKLGKENLKANIHNFSIPEGDYRLQDGSKFSDMDTDQHQKSKVSLELFNKTKTLIDDFFVVHQIYRSCEEYVASLSRGRNHAGDEQPIKANRDGYILEAFSQPGLEFNINKEKLEKYNTFYDCFVSETEINDLVVEAREFNQSKYFDVVARVRSSKDFLLLYRNQFKGTKLNDRLVDKINYSHIIYSIDKVKFNERDGSFVIVGWAFDTLSEQLPAILHDISSSITTSTTIDRPDVKKIHQDAPLKCGFELLITSERSSTRLTAGDASNLLIKGAFSSESITIKLN
jgi:hypothetical protein